MTGSKTMSKLPHQLEPTGVLGDEIVVHPALDTGDHSVDVGRLQRTGGVNPREVPGLRKSGNNVGLQVPISACHA